MPKSILAVLTILSTLFCSNLTSTASAAQSRCQLAAPSTGNAVALTGKKCGLKRVYSRPQHRR